jgi:hemerythrin
MLFELVNRLLAATEKASLTDAIVKLGEYTRAHFTHEETLMRAMAYPYIVTHVEQHNTLLSKLNNVADLVANYTFDVTTFKSFLAAWLLNHIETVDAQLVSFIGRK